MSETLQKAHLATAWRPLVVYWSPRGVVALGLLEQESELDLELMHRRGIRPTTAPLPEPLGQAIAQHLERPGAVCPPLDLTGIGAFSRAVYQRLLAVPWGATISYKALAAAAGHPTAARAVGQAMARNPLPLLIPCHRVLPQDGRLGHYGLGGSAAKAELLSREGAPFR